jgi:hypothetical protein
MGAPRVPPKPCPSCKVAMQVSSDEPNPGYDTFTCNNCGFIIFAKRLGSDRENNDGE